ncbi:MAG: DUF2798 domain-containing protein [Pseudomonadota bacterium]
MFSAKYERIIFQFLLSGIMSFVVSGTATARITGFEDFMFGAWIDAWLPAWLVAFPTIVVISPLVMRFAKSLIKTAD